MCIRDSNFNAQGIVLAQIKKEIEELNKKVDKILDQPFKNAMHHLKHAINYLKYEDIYHEAYEQFKMVCDIDCPTAFGYVDDIEDKVLCKRLAIFARLMINTYNEEKNEFVPLASLPVTTKRVIGEAIRIDLDEVIDAFNKIAIPLGKMLMGQGDKAKMKNQQALDPLLKTCLPMIWHFLPEKWLEDEKEELLRYIPEGIEDAAKITLDNAYFMVWKDLTKKKEFKLKWVEDEHNINRVQECMQIKCLTTENNLYLPFLLDTNKVPHDIKEGKENAAKIRGELLDGPFLAWKDKGNVQWDYDGNFREVTWTMPEVEKFLIGAPDDVKHQCVDKSWKQLMGHAIAWKGVAHLIKWVLNKTNITQKDEGNGFTPLHYAAKNGHLETVKELLEVKGGKEALNVKSDRGRCPIDVAKGESFKKNRGSGNIEYRTYRPIELAKNNSHNCLLYTSDAADE